MVSWLLKKDAHGRLYVRHVTEGLSHVHVLCFEALYPFCLEEMDLRK